MSQETVEQIVGRLMLDAAFRQQMAADRESTLSAFDLTDEERTTLATLDLNDLPGPTGLDDRISRAPWGAN